MNPQATAPVPASGGVTAASPQGPTALPQAATAVPSFDTSGALSAIRNYYQIPQQAQAAGVQGQGLAGQSDWMNKRNEIQTNYAREQAAHNAEASAYRLQPDPNGGPSKLYNIYTGQQVNALEFQQKTGASPIDVYKNSTNKNDQTFVNDYQNLEEYMNAKLNPTAENKLVAQSYENAHPQLKQLTPDQVRQSFMSTYGSYFGMNGAAPSSQDQYAPQLGQSGLQYVLNRNTYNPGSVNIPGYDFNIQDLIGNNGSPSQPSSQFGGVSTSSFQPKPKK